MLSQQSVDKFHAPKYSDNFMGEAKWSSLHESKFDSALTADLFSFIHYEAKRRGWNDSLNNRTVKDGSNMFHPEFLEGQPSKEWNKAYNQGVKDHEKDFITHMLNRFNNKVDSCNL